MKKEILSNIVDNLTGKKDVWEGKYREKYGNKDCSLEINKEKKKLLKTYLILVVGVGILMMAATISYIVDLKVITEIEKPKFGDPIKYVDLNVKATYEGTAFRQKLKVPVHSPLLGEKEKKKILEEYGKNLENCILKDNKDLSNVIGNLELPERDEPTGIIISWTSDAPEIIDKNGKIDFINLERETMIVLKGEGVLEEAIENYFIDIRVIPTSKNVSYEKSIEEKLKNMEKEIKEPKKSRVLVLPTILDEKVKLKWTRQGSQSIVLIAALFTLVFFIIYRRKFDVINKEVRSNREEIKKEFPYMMDKIILLLNSGLVISTALEKINEDYRKKKKERGWERKQLYEELYEIERRVKETNSPLLGEIKDFAKRSGVRELLRFSVILSENINKGAALAEKLEAEGEMLWISRKKHAEEMGRLAETKLTLPLMILLIVFIVITITPALMEM